jgi:RNA-directed DNA polymerase
MRTEKSRLRRSLMSLQEKMRQMRHLTIGQQLDELNDALCGHYEYYGIAGNIRALQKVYRRMERYWCGMVRSRSLAGRRLTRTDFNQLKEKIPQLQ